MNKQATDELIQKVLRNNFMGYDFEGAVNEIRSWSGSALRQTLREMESLDTKKLKSLKEKFKKAEMIKEIEKVMSYHWKFISKDNIVVPESLGMDNTPKEIISAAEKVLKQYYLLDFKDADQDAAEEQLIERKSYPRNELAGNLSHTARQAVLALQIASDKLPATGKYNCNEQIKYLEKEYINPIKSTKNQ